MWRLEKTGVVAVLLGLMVARTFGTEECFDHDDYTLAFLPDDLFVFEAGSFKACCQVVNFTDMSVANVSLESTNLEFSCSNNTGDVISEVPSTESQYHDIKLSPFSVCTNLTVFAKPGHFCRCKVQGRTKCSSHDYIRIDAPLPSNLTFECLTYLNNITCKLALPHFHYKDSVTTTMDLKAGGVEMGSMVCSSYDTCVIIKNEKNKIIFSFFIELEISMTTEYNTCAGRQKCVGRNVTVTSDWKSYKPESRLLLDSVTPNVFEANATTISVKWELGSVLNDRIVNISYASLDPWSNSRGYQAIKKNHYDVNDVTQSRMTLSDLSPLTRYNICLSVRLGRSSLWSNPGCVEAVTKSYVPATSPKTRPDAFTVLDTSSVTVYWQPLLNWEWNSETDEGRRYILQQYDQTSLDWRDRRSINWTEVQTKVKVWGQHRNWGAMRIMTANDLGHADNGSVVFDIPRKEDILPGPKKMLVVYTLSKRSINVSWQSDDTSVQPTVFWCQKKTTSNSCLNSFEWSKPAVKGDKSLTVSNIQESTLPMFGVSLSKTDGADVLRSGIHWQPCIQVIDGNSTSFQGDCEKILEGQTNEFPAYAIAIVVFFVLALLLLVTFCFMRRRRRKARLAIPGPEPISNGVAGHGAHREDADNHDYERIPGSLQDSVNVSGLDALSTDELMPCRPLPNHNVWSYANGGLGPFGERVELPGQVEGDIELAQVCADERGNIDDSDGVDDRGATGDRADGSDLLNDKGAIDDRADGGDGVDSSGGSGVVDSGVVDRADGSGSCNNYNNGRGAIDDRGGGSGIVDSSDVFNSYDESLQNDPEVTAESEHRYSRMAPGSEIRLDSFTDSNNSGVVDSGGPVVMPGQTTVGDVAWAPEVDRIRV